MSIKLLISLICVLTPTGASSSAVNSPSDDFVMSLYKRHMKDDKAEGNAIHAILPKQGLIEGDVMFVYNLTAIHEQENILSADLHVQSRFSSSKMRGAFLRMSVCDIATREVPILEEIELKLNASGWQTFDVTSSIRFIRRSRRNYHLLGLKVELKRPYHSKYHSLHWRRLRKMRFEPYIIVHANDSFSIEDDLQHHFLPPVEVKHASQLVTSIGDRVKRSRRSLETVSKQHGRFKRAVSENGAGYFRYDVTDAEQEQVVSFVPHQKQEETEQNVYTERPIEDESKYRHGNGIEQKIQKEIENRATISKQEFQNRLIPYPKKHGKRPQRRRKSRKNRRRKPSKNRILPNEWHKPKYQEDSKNSNKTLSGCHRQKLTINFNSLGWSDWIIAPQSFEAFYCAGTCQYPLRKGNHPTNHAAIQSLASMLRMDTNGEASTSEAVPAPCCVPDAMDSLSLLFYDKTKETVVLKNYPNMIVKSCACR